MFDDILRAVKEHFAENPHLAAAVPAEQHDAVQKEIAAHVADHVAPVVASDPAAAATVVPTQSTSLTGGFGGILDKLKGSITSGSPVVTAIEGGLVGSLANKFGLNPAITGAIAASLPGLLQKLAANTAASH